MTLCRICQEPLTARYYELMCRVTRVGDGPAVAAWTSEAERLCSAQCALVRLSHLVDDVTGARSDVPVTAAARARVQRVTMHGA